MLSYPERQLSVEIAGNVHEQHQIGLRMFNPSALLIGLAFKPALGEGYGICFVCWNTDIWRDAVGIDGVARQPHGA